MIGASIVLGRALAPIEQGIGSWRSFTAAREANSRIKILLRSGQPFVEPTALPPPAGKVSVENLSLVLQGHDRPVLRQVSFVLEPGSVLAIVGPSAAGKSTLCRVLVGSWRPSIGHVRIDGAALEHWRTEDRNRHMGYLPQSIELFGGTVRQNIARLGDASDAEVVKAAQRAGCHDMILRLTKGYDTEIGEGGIFAEAWHAGGSFHHIHRANAFRLHVRTNNLVFSTSVSRGMIGGFQMGGLMRGDGAQYELPRALLIAKKTARASPIAFRSPELVDTFGRDPPRLGEKSRIYLSKVEFTEMSTIALKHGATVDKFIGDALLVFFGDPETQGIEEDARACLRMAVVEYGARIFAHGASMGTCWSANSRL